jgi:hypothetical protein
MAHVDIARAPALRAVMPFYGAAAVAFLALSVLLFFSADAFAGHYFHPKLLALVHLAALGWGTMVVFGAGYQLLPVVFERSLYSETLALVSFFALTPGVALLVYSFWRFEPGLAMQSGATLVFLATILFMWNVVLTAGDATRYSIQKLFLITASIWLVFTALVGVLLVLNFTRPVFSRDHLAVLRLHAHMGLAGWFLLLIFGVASKLLPMFLLGKSSREGWLRVAFYGVNAGLVGFLVDGWYNGLQPRVLLYVLLVAAGAAAFFGYVFDVFRNRMRRQLDVPMRHALLSFVLLALALAVLPAIICEPGQHRLALVYGVLVFLGWITSIILGQTFKTLPFIRWNSTYKQFSGKQKLPMPRDLFRESWLTPQFAFYVVGLTVLVTGLITGSFVLIKLASLLFVFVGTIYTVNVFNIIFHKSLVTA